MKNVGNGRLDPKAAPVSVLDHLSVAIIDGCNAMPTTTAVEGMKLAIAKAKKTGIAYVCARNSSHIGALAYYSLMAANEGLIGVAMTNTDPVMTVPGGKAQIIGTNPIAYAIPTGTSRPIYLDIATSSVAVNRILQLKAVGKKLPEKWLVDEHGVPTDDPSGFPEKLWLLPMALHKGYGLAILVETLSAIISGSAFLSGVGRWLQDSTQKVDQGHAFIAIDVSSILPIGEFYQRIHAMTDEIQSAPKAENSDKIYLPGEIEHENRVKALAEGLTLPDYVLVNLYGLAESIGDIEGLNGLFV
jgi:ureidoglycolate dehydrogenase (NAD+)